MSTPCSTTTDTVVSKSADNQADIEAIASVIQAYAEGGPKGNQSSFKALAVAVDRLAQGQAEHALGAKRFLEVQQAAPVDRVRPGGAQVGRCGE